MESQYLEYWISRLDNKLGFDEQYIMEFLFIDDKMKNIMLAAKSKLQPGKTEYPFSIRMHEL